MRAYSTSPYSRCGDRKPYLIRYIDPGTGYVISTWIGWLAAFLLSFLGIFSFFARQIFTFFRKNKKITVLVLLFLVLLIGGMKMVTMHKSVPSTFDGKIIMLGMDGLSPKIIELMMEDGKLPHFAKLMKQGSYGHLSTTNPSQSPVAWTGFSTGQNPGKNGLFDFIRRDPKTYRLALAIGNIQNGVPIRVVKSKCFWQYASEMNIPSVIISCPITFPPDKIYGRMLSGMGVPDILGTEGTFSFYTSEPLPKKEDIGGKVFEVEKKRIMSMNLIGPRAKVSGGKPQNVKVPFTVTMGPEQNSIVIELQGERFELTEEHWSNWKNVTFSLGPIKKMKGILKFYLVESSPQFKLYVSPINFDPRDPFFPISYPKGYAKELAENIGLFYTQGMPMHTWALNEERLSEEPFLEQVNEVLREKKAMLDFELNRFQKGVLFCYFESPDIIQHMFWRYTDPEHPIYEENAPCEYKEMINTWYRKMDAILGSVMERINNEDILIVLSDHGFDTFRRAVHLNSWLRENGYLELSYWKETGAELLSDIDWSRTRAYSIGFGAIYINQKGREGNGIVSPGEETELLKEEISRRLERWIDNKYRERVINKVYMREEIFWGDYVDEAPDLYVGFNIGYRASWQTALGAVPKELIEDNTKKWSGSHLFDPNLIPGIIFCNRQLRRNPSIYDIAPTVLKLIGFSEEKIRECNFDGEPLF